MHHKEQPKIKSECKHIGLIAVKINPLCEQFETTESVQEKNFLQIVLIQ